MITHLRIANNFRKAHRESVLRKMGLITPRSMLGNPPLASTPTTGAGTPNTEDLKVLPKPNGGAVRRYHISYGMAWYGTVWYRTV